MIFCDKSFCLKLWILFAPLRTCLFSGSVWDHEDYRNSPDDDGRYDVETFEWDVSCTHVDAGCYRWIRDGVQIGFATDVSDVSQRFLFTDIVRKQYDESIAQHRFEAQSRGCWHGFTPDMCCANGGWDGCFSGVYNYEYCCLGWVMDKDRGVVIHVRSAYMSAMRFGLMATNENQAVPTHGHALVCGAMVSTIEHDQPLVLVELGVLDAGFSSTLLSDLTRRGIKPGSYYLVDLWQGEGGRDPTTYRRHFHNSLELLAPWWDAAHFIQERSDVAARLMLDESVDFVFVDADHTYAGVKKDLIAWWPKLRSGGYMVGHDYVYHRPTHYSGVLGAVLEFAESIKLSHRLFGILGSTFVLIKE